MRILGLDVGDKRIGVALSDPMEILASTLTLIERRDGEAHLAAIIDLVREYDVGRIVVGFPRSMDGSVGPQAEKVNAFTRELARRTSVPIEMSDERLSSVIADRLLRDGGRSPAQIRKRRDAAAAAVILQWYLDRRRGMEAESV